MAKDQSHLYTGMTSSTPSRNKAKAAAKARDERRQKKKEERRELQQETDIPRLGIEFKKEIDKLLYAPYTITLNDGKILKEEELSDEQFRVERRSRRIAIKSLLSIQKRVVNVLREPVDRKKEAADARAEVEAAGEMDLSTDDFEK